MKIKTCKIHVSLGFPKKKIDFSRKYLKSMEDEKKAGDQEDIEFKKILFQKMV